MMSSMHVTYSAGADAAYIQLGQADGKVSAREVGPGVLVDVDSQGEAVGVEILGLQRRGLSLGQVVVEVIQEDAEALPADHPMVVALTAAEGTEPPAAATG